MILIKKFSYYIFGLTLGLIFVFAVFGKRLFITWLPKSLLKENILKTKEIISLEKMNGFTVEEFNTWIKQSKIDFGKSDTHKKPCPVYFIYNENIDSKIKEMNLEVCDTLVKINKVL